MPNPVNALHNEQWDVCARCGALFPISRLSRQKGFKVCARCFDNLDIEKRAEIIADKLGVDNNEGIDLRDEEPAFFDMEDF